MRYDQAGVPYYVNLETGASQWECPQNFPYGVGAEKKILWELRHDQNGAPYYCNYETGASQWVCPPNFPYGPEASTKAQVKTDKNGLPVVGPLNGECYLPGQTMNVTVVCPFISSLNDFQLNLRIF
jgi:hypothetical protein